MARSSSSSSSSSSSGGGARPVGARCRMGWLAQLGRMWPLLPLVSTLLLSLVTAALGNSGLDHCHINSHSQCQQPAHYFYYDSRDHPIVIEDSNRISHRIINRILLILLQSVAGYNNVEIRHCHSYDSLNVTTLLDRVSARKVSTHCQPPIANSGSIPDTMVNMEAWMTAGFNMAPWLDTGQLLDAGPLGPQGRLGWYLPTAVVQDLWAKGQHVADHWRALQVRKITRHLSWWGRPELDAIRPDYRTEAYQNTRCQENAKGLRRNCATLFAARHSVDTEMLKSQIESLDLLVDIVWLEDQFTQFVSEQMHSGQLVHVLLFDWQPNTLIASGQFTRIQFPDTHMGHKNAPRDCDFPVNQLTKVVWTPLKHGAPDAFYIISKIQFSDLEYDQLLNNSWVQPSLSPSQIACRWVQANAWKWEVWLPTNLCQKPKVYLGGLFPLRGKSWSQPGLIEGAKLALERVNLDSRTLPNHTLELLVSDTECEYDTAISRFISLMQKPDPPVLGILGTGCSDPAERIAALSKHFNMLMVSYGAEAQTLSDREKYPYFFRTVPPVQHYTNVYPDLFRELGWGTVGALAEEGQELPEYHLNLQDKLQHHGISLLVRRKFLNNTGTPNVRQILEEFKAQNVRVIIADVFSNLAREIMCEAYKQEMTAYEGYVWFLPWWYPTDWSDVEYYNGEPNLQEPHSYRENVPCTSAEVEKASEGHFVLSRAFTAPPNTRAAGGITVKEYQELYTHRCGAAYVEESKFASFVYDAVWVYAKGLHSLLLHNQWALETIHTTAGARAFRAAIGNLSFNGVSGLIQFTGSDRHADLVILQVFSNETRQIGQYSPSSGAQTGGDGSLLQIDSSRIRWLSPIGGILDKLEHVEDECPIESFRAQLGVTCTIASVMVVVIVFFGFVIIVIFFLIIMKYRCDAKMKKFKAAHERIKELGLLNEDFSQILTVDDWEIPRKNVVLNRELGEGAFGTVMGGEMYKEGEGWVAVAVKTLKVRHTMEEKLDFFSEVNMMKCFAHENIVQLWGVCTRKEPIFAVMEYLLHGDLKTYLLSRRSLVGQGVKEAEDVKAENLTQMAVDVATGLYYLHSLKYVHRDLACRNCLVHANKTVKIGDFGMTRHISSTDYYRFSRKGMLPVRWTAPEALKDGIYSAKSDIWSFGVLVFEIVTFGSFPYQGLSNKEVLDYVSRGHQLMLPEKCPADLKSFVHWCMSSDPGYRPDLDDILSYLNFSPAFLAPCLDAPTTSVVHEDTDSLEMQIPASSVNDIMGSSVPVGFLSSTHLHTNSIWQGKLKDKKKTFSVPGLSSLGKSGKSSLPNRSPKSSRSSSVYSGTVPSTSVCGLHACMTGASWGASVSVVDDHDDGDEDDEDDRNVDFIGTRCTEVGSESELQSLHSRRNSQPERKEIVCDVDIEFRRLEHRKSFGSDQHHYASTAGSDKGEDSSGYLSQESKHFCQTITSL